MFYINDYNYINSIISSLGGGKGGRGTKGTLLRLLTYFFLLLLVILEAVEPLSESKTFNNLKKNQVAMTFFFLFVFLTPLMTFGIIWAFESINNKKRKVVGFIIMLTIFNLFQCISTIVALGYGKPDISKTRQGYLYSKVIILFIAIMVTTTYLLMSMSN